MREVGMISIPTVAYPTLCKERKGWGTRLFVGVLPCQHLPLRSDWANEKEVASVELLRCKLHLEFLDLRAVPTFLARP